MINSTTATVTDKRIAATHGLVTGNTIRSRFILKDIFAMFKMIAGGEVRTYTEMMISARKQALERMNEAAADLGANAVVSVRFTTSMIAAGNAEILAYGTAVTLEDDTPDSK